MKIPFWATVFTLLASIVLVSLGMWQIQRMNWKNDLLVRIRTQLSQDSTKVYLDPDTDLSEMRINRGVLKGEYIHDKAFKLQSQTFRGEVGYHVITPFKMADYGGKVIFVNRGWIPLETELDDPNVLKTEGMLRVVGILKIAPKYNSFLPDNNPEKDEWYKIIPSEMARARGIEDYYDANIFYKETSRERGALSLPVGAGSGDLNISNNHAGYAVFWLSMFVVIWIIYFLRFIAPQIRKTF